MIRLHFDKLYGTARKLEPCQAAVPFPRGACRDEKDFWLVQEGRRRPVQTKVTSRWEDGSVRWLHVDFQADFRANQAEECFLAAGAEAKTYPLGDAEMLTMGMEPETKLWMEAGTKPGMKPGKRIQVSADFSAELPEAGEDRLIKEMVFRGKALPCAFPCPVLRERTADGVRDYESRVISWETVEEGALTAAYACTMELNREDGEKQLRGEALLRFWGGKPWVELEYRLVNTCEERLDIASLGWRIAERGGGCGTGSNSECRAGNDAGCRAENDAGCRAENDAGCGAGSDAGTAGGPVRTMTGISNYRTRFQVSETGERLQVLADADLVMNTANEHFAEVFFGTLFCSRSRGDVGITATIWQAQQNFPKAVTADEDGLEILLVPEGKDRVVMEPGMARTQKVLLHVHEGNVPKEELAARSTIYQMPDKCRLDPEIYHQAGVFEDVFLASEKRIPEYEWVLRARADNHARGYGMLNWGDAPDPGYTKQRRGGDEVVWTNNEYDFPHACFLLYARTGERRFLDYGLVAAEHWMDVDVCHYSKDPLLFGGQWEHTRRHVVDSTIVCSHQWVEGLLDYWHFTGDPRAFETAVGIGENVLRLLDTPMFHQKGGINARETGWALRTLSALYRETQDEKWLSRCQWIVGHFTEWKEEYGHWLSPYLDNTFIHVVFMISVAVGSLMRYYRIRPEESLRQMIVEEVEDMVNSCMLEDGTFYYKELPSLNRSGTNPLILEALVYAWELTGDRKFLEAGLVTFGNIMAGNKLSIGGEKRHEGDAVIQSGDGTKTFAQSFLPLAIYYKAAAEEGLLG